MLKIGITYLYTILNYGYPPTVEDDLRALDEVGSLGFRFLEMEGLGADHLQGLVKHKRAYARAIESNGLYVHNFCLVHRDLVSVDDRVRRAAYDVAKVAVEVAREFRSETLHLASYAPEEVTFVDGPPYSGSTYRLKREYRVEIPDTFRWERQWRALVESTRAVSDLAAEADLKVIMEPRVGEIICSSDSLLRLIEDVNRPNFFANFDCAHFQAQREIIPLSLERLRGKYANVHIADNDPVSTEHLPLGEGIIDWDGFFRTLARHGYEGYLAACVNTGV